MPTRVVPESSFMRPPPPRGRPRLAAAARRAAVRGAGGSGGAVVDRGGGGAPRARAAALYAATIPTSTLAAPFRASSSETLDTRPFAARCFAVTRSSSPGRPAASSFVTRSAPAFA